MIELRWLERPLYQIGDVVPEGVNVSNSIVRVLQYRQRTFSEGVFAGMGGYGQWTNWQDVPVVKP